MLDKINRYAHGFVAVPVICACSEAGVFELLAQKKALKLEEIVEELGANSGHLMVALRLLESLSFLYRSESEAYTLTEESQQHQIIPKALMSLYKYPFESYVKGEVEAEISNWIKYSSRRWDTENSLLSDLLDGVLVIPLLLELKKQNLLDESKKLFNTLTNSLQQELSKLFINLGWAEEKTEGLYLTDIGKFMRDRSLILGTTASYAPMLLQMKELLFGNPQQVFQRDQTENERHVNRVLNVVASGFQHEKFFADTDKIILSIFNQQPIEEQPSYIVDMGCGDGTLLKRVYKIIKEFSARGKVLTEHPIVMVGADYNQEALDVTDKNLGEIPHLIIPGDIGAPEKLLEKFKVQGIEAEKVLHIRSFLDHDRPFIAPKDTEKSQVRSELDYQVVDVDPEGKLIPPHIAVQSLVEHLERWSSIITRHGLLLLEVHSLTPAVVQKYIDESESLHFDAYHAFSMQHLVEADVFLMAGAEVGLFSKKAAFRKYPKMLPLTRITVNHFEKREYQIRYATVKDIPNLLNCATINQPGSESWFEVLLKQDPTAHLVLESQGDLVAAILTEANYSTEVLEVREFLVGTTVENWQVLAKDLLEFVEQWAIVKPGIQEIDGLLKYHEAISSLTNSKWHQSSVLSKKLTEKVALHQLATLELCDLMAPEYELEAFAARWLLRVFQDMGVFLREGEFYLESELISKLKISSRYQRLFNALLQILQKRGIVKVEKGRVWTLARCQSFAIKDVASDVAAFHKYFSEKYPAHSSWLTVVKRCLDKYPLILRGEVDVNEVVFTDGDMELFAGLFLGHRVADYFNELLADGVCWEVEQRLLENRDGLIRILEIGAGTGGVTGILLEKLAPYGEKIEFWFTDISSTFTRYGETKFKQYPWVKYEIFDVEKSLDVQGIKAESFDVVIANNVLHSTKLIHQTLKNNNSLLNTGGLLALLEFTQPIDVLLYFGGFLQGFWLFEDPENRLEVGCLLSIPLWQKVLSDCGFDEIIPLGLPCEMHDLSKARESVIFARKHQLQAIESSEEIPQNLTENGKYSQTEINSPSISSVESSSKLEIFELECRKLLKTLLGVERMESLSGDTPLMESGMDSLELLEFRAVLERKFGIKLKSTFFFSYKTLIEVAEYLSEKDSQTEIDSPSISSEESSSKLEIFELECRKLLKTLLGVERMESLSGDTPLMESGMDSLELLEFRAVLERKFGIKLKSTFFFSYKTLIAVAEYLSEREDINLS
ncbi:MAG: methyltransferase [Okeania sp. SIO2G4]|uniref:AprA-related methyltransferase n=1 Tax=unclassified Okeania TaxID=2634635 RepID=UPI0013BC8821|nr:MULTISPECIES: phosphopantetheine-binding protein [unclassified Okeania]NEP72538.1 methyltransferase [Okeania sp. SIO2G5]NEP95494.1 methyltransferase [Okeania sp. SIO2F5]NEQ91247.1 methyltransferase [Okeania sp. SIO2G4]